MSEFDGYYNWLGIPPAQQPPNHYRLLGLQDFESNADVIDNAADRQTAHIRTYQAGSRAALSQQILNEIARARLCLLNPSTKEEYDRNMRSEIQQPFDSRPLPRKPPGRKPPSSSSESLPAVPMSASGNISKPPILKPSSSSSEILPAVPMSASGNISMPPVLKPSSSSSESLPAVPMSAPANKPATSDPSTNKTRSWDWKGGSPSQTNVSEPQPEQPKKEERALPPPLKTKPRGLAAGTSWGIVGVIATLLLGLVGGSLLLLWGFPQSDEDVALDTPDKIVMFEELVVESSADGVEVAISSDDHLFRQATLVRGINRIKVPQGKITVELVGDNTEEFRVGDVQSDSDGKSIKIESVLSVGELVIESSADDIKLTIKSNGRLVQTATLSKGENRLRIPSGKIEYELIDNVTNLQLSSTTGTLEKEGQLSLEISPIPLGQLVIDSEVEDAKVAIHSDGKLVREVTLSKGGNRFDVPAGAIAIKSLDATASYAISSNVPILAIQGSVRFELKAVVKEGTLVIVSMIESAKVVIHSSGKPVHVATLKKGENLFTVPAGTIKVQPAEPRATFTISSSSPELTARGTVRFEIRNNIQKVRYQLASSSRDKSILLWDTETGEELGKLRYSKDDFFSLAFSPDGRTLATACRNSAVILWDIDTKKIRQTLMGHGLEVLFVTYNSDGRLLASASRDNTIIVWNSKTGKVLQKLVGHVTTVPCVVFSPDSRLLASASNDETIKIWDPVAGKELRTLKGHTGYVKSVAFSSDGKLLASAGEDKKVRLWDPETGEKLETLEGHFSPVNSLAFSPDGRMLASADDDGGIKLWDPRTGKKMPVILGGHAKSILSIAFSPDGRMLASAGRDATIKLWDTRTGKTLQTLTEHKGDIFSVAFGPAVKSPDKTVSP